jgi:peptidoglycan-associated lipoprotein
MKRYLMLCATIIFIAVLMLTVSCASNKGSKGQSGSAATEEGIGEGELSESEIGASAFKEVTEKESALAFIFKDINFGYDSFALKPEAKSTLDKVAEALLGKPAIQVMIEGHCDDRGTSEYNLALGQRRANSAKKYLVQLGVSAARIFTISYGE